MPVCRQVNANRPQSTWLQSCSSGEHWRCCQRHCYYWTQNPGSAAGAAGRCAACCARSGARCPRAPAGCMPARAAVPLPACAGRYLGPRHMSMSLCAVACKDSVHQTQTSRRLQWLVKVMQSMYVYGTWCEGSVDGVQRRVPFSDCCMHDDRQQWEMQGRTCRSSSRRLVRATRGSTADSRNAW